ncbi:hypothetical protein [Kurthia sibirica]|uniref:hypothetical protein n=1 Tax=Kurthia sibirica TaxID=202750 RepID=UPI00116EC68E|nr:hypothetical protein [Kurthia sibirica]GEK35445.1 hypothetical protein KSI01_29780 [Kurthia sibirica]
MNIILDKKANLEVLEQYRDQLKDELYRSQNSKSPFRMESIGTLEQIEDLTHEGLAQIIIQTKLHDMKINSLNAPTCVLGTDSELSISTIQKGDTEPLSEMYFATIEGFNNYLNRIIQLDFKKEEVLNNYEELERARKLSYDIDSLSVDSDGIEFILETATHYYKIKFT